MSNNHWLLYNAKSCEERGPFTEEEARSELQSVDANEITKWFAWREGWSDWAAIEKVSELKTAEAAEILKAPPRPMASSMPANANKSAQMSKAVKTKNVAKESRENSVIKRNPIKEKSVIAKNPLLRDMNESSFNKKPRAESKDSDKRQYKRHNLKLKVVLISEDKAFRTYTQDVSLGGLRLAAVIPSEFFQRPCQIYISKIDDSENLDFTARLVNSHKNNTSLKFDADPGIYLLTLKKWLEKSDSDSTKKVA